MVKKSRKMSRGTADIQALPLFKDRLGVWLTYAGASYYDQYRDKLAPLGLRPSWVTALAIIEQEPGITQSALGRWMAINRASAMAVASGMEDAGLITRTTPPGRNQTALHLTKEGISKLHEACAIEAGITRHLSARLTEAERQNLLPALSKLLEGLAEGAPLPD